MRTYERNGVHVDQCTECRGIFLDRGELERLIDADSRFQGSASGPPQPAPPAAHQQPAQYHQQQQHGGHGYGKPPKRKKSIFEELFD